MPFIKLCLWSWSFDASYDDKEHIDKLEMCLRNTDARRQQSPNMAKISKSFILTQPHLQGHGMSMKCQEPIHELTVQVWLLYSPKL